MKRWLKKSCNQKTAWEQHEKANYLFAAKCRKGTLTLWQIGVSPELGKLMTWDFTGYPLRYPVTSEQSFIVLYPLEGSVAMYSK